MSRAPIVVLLAAALLAGCAARPDATPTAGRFVDVHGARSWVEIEGHGPPLVFLHGGLVFYDNTFAAQRASFAATRTVIGIDRIGHGHSPDDGQPFTYQRMADETAIVIAALGVGRVDVVGHSDGGDIALLLARDHPALVRRVVVSGANLRAGLPSAELERRTGLSAAQLAERLDAVERFLPPRIRTDYEAVSPDGAAHWRPFLEKSYRLWLTPVVIDTAGLKSIAAPVLVIAGDHDFASLEETTEMFRGLPKGELLIEPGVGHDTFGDRPALTDLAIREFLDRPDR